LICKRKKSFLYLQSLGWMCKVSHLVNFIISSSIFCVLFLMEVRSFLPLCQKQNDTHPPLFVDGAFAFTMCFVNTLVTHYYYEYSFEKCSWPTKSELKQRLSWGHFRVIPHFLTNPSLSLLQHSRTFSCIVILDKGEEVRNWAPKVFLAVL
jgi:hypothetical protein